MVIPPPLKPGRITNFLKPYVLQMHFSNKYVSAQVLHTPTASVASSASSQEKALRPMMENTRDVAAAAKIGNILGERVLLCLQRLRYSSMICFVDPGMVGANGCGTVKERARELSFRFSNGERGAYFLVPYNAVNHWSLTVVHPETQVVYHMDPLKRRLASAEWIEVVDTAIKFYKESSRTLMVKKITWENLAGVPLQTGAKDCGLFVMRYMKEICNDKEFSFHIKWKRRGNLAYNDDDLNEIRIQWAKYFVKNAR